MGKRISKILATGVAKVYYDNEDSFEAFGTLYSTWGMHYTAAGEKGVWLCSFNPFTNEPSLIGLIPWKYFTRMVIDGEHELVYLESDDFDGLLSELRKSLRRHHSGISHKMSDTGKMALCIPLELMSGSIIPYLSARIPTEEKIEELTKKETIWGTIGIVLVVVLFLFALICSFL